MGGEAAVPDADVALCVWMHGAVAAVPEEPDILLVCYGLRVEEIVINFGIWAEVEEVCGDGMETWWNWVVHGDCIITTKSHSVDYLYMLLILYT